MKDKRVSKEDFINFLSSSTPEEINKFIEEKGKPHTLISPVFFYPKKENKR